MSGKVGWLKQWVVGVAVLWCAGSMVSVVFASDPDASTKTHVLNAINPGQGNHPGGRGADELVAYTPDGGERTGTNTYGIEAVVRGGFVVSVGGNDSPIPADGFIISGHGQAAHWIATQLSPGMKASVNVRAKELVVVTDSRSRLESVRYGLAAAKERFDRNRDALSHDDQGRFMELVAAAQPLLDTVAGHLQSKEYDPARLALSRLEPLVEKAQLASTRSPKAETRGFWDRISARSPEEIKQLMTELADQGVNCYLPEVMYGGATIVPSDFVPQHERFEGWDPLAAIIEQGHERGIEVHAWVHNMHVGRAGSPLVRAHPDWLMTSRDGKRHSTLEPGYHYFSWCHPEARRMLLNHYKEIARRYPTLDGLHLDYIRFPVTDPAREDFDYCDGCRAAFKAKTGLDPMDITPAQADAWRQWCAYREALVNSFVEETATELRKINPKIQISAAVFMPLDEARSSKYQNWGLWVDEGWLDFICPMIYTFDQQAVEKQTAEMVARVADKARVYPGLGAYMGVGPMRLVDQVALSRDAGGDGVVLFSWRSTREAQRRVLRDGPFRHPATPTPTQTSLPGSHPTR